MQRHSSNRGEALAEVTAARTLVGRRQLAKSASKAQAERWIAHGRWFVQPIEAARLPKRKLQKRDETVTLML